MIPVLYLFDILFNFVIYIKKIILSNFLGYEIKSILKEEKIGEISPIYLVSTGGDMTNGGDKSAGRFFAKNRQKNRR